MREKISRVAFAIQQIMTGSGGGLQWLMKSTY